MDRPTTRTLRRCLAALACLLALPGAAAEPTPARLSLGPLYGPARPALVAQLREAVCARADCVPWNEIVSGEQPDPGKARRLGVAVAVTGIVSSRDGRLGLSLSVFSGPPLERRLLRLELAPDGSLRPDQLARATRVIAAGLRSPAAAPPPGPRRLELVAGPLEVLAPGGPTLEPSAEAPRPAPSPDPPAATVPLALAPPLEPSPLPAPATDPASPLAAPTGPAPAAASPSREASQRRPWISIELGGGGARREIDYQGADPAAGPAVAFSAPTVATAHGRLTIFPWSAGEAPGPGGLGLFAEADLSVAFETGVAGYGSRPTTLVRSATGLTWISPPLGAWRTVLAPALARQRRAVVVRPPVPGLPDTELTGYSLSLDVETEPLSPVGLLVGGGLVRWAGAPDPLGGGSGQEGVAWGLEARFGLQVALGEALDLRLLGGWSARRYAIPEDPTGATTVTGASDREASASLSLRAMY